MYSDPMNTREELWADYQRQSRPPNIGDTISGVSLGEVDDDVQDVLGSWGPQLDARRVARLGRAAADLERVLPLIAPQETREYFALVSALARAALDAIAEGEFVRGKTTQ
ncbi:MAG: hypothetical protein ACREMM_12900 [Gemmatimonadales bacterium]